MEPNGELFSLVVFQFILECRGNIEAKLFSLLKKLMTFGERETDGQIQEKVNGVKSTYKFKLLLEQTKLVFLPNYDAKSGVKKVFCDFESRGTFDLEREFTFEDSLIKLAKVIRGIEGEEIKFVAGDFEYFVNNEEEIKNLLPLCMRYNESVQKYEVTKEAKLNTNFHAVKFLRKAILMHKFVEVESSAGYLDETTLTQNFSDYKKVNKNEFKNAKTLSANALSFLRAGLEHHVLFHGLKVKDLYDSKGALRKKYRNNTDCGFLKVFGYVDNKTQISDLIAKSLVILVKDNELYFDLLLKNKYESFTTKLVLSLRKS